MSTSDTQWIDAGSVRWWTLTTVLHLPMVVILALLTGGLVERVGYFWRGRRLPPPGRMPALPPTVCVQLPMFNEHAVAARVIDAACALVWPAGRLTVQVLDDSTDPETRLLVERACADAQARTGVPCTLLRRTDRRGYKAGALEAGRHRTDAEFIAILDADFVPPSDYLVRAIPYFYRPDGMPDYGLALVQAQWGHLNHDKSALTRAQALWVDDHHTLQMSWRSAMWRFVNFTGTAGIWRAYAIRSVGGWRAASLVEDCELSFRHLFAGYRTTFVKQIVVPAELPATYAAYKAQQRRWTQGWVQLQRLHLPTLAFRHRTRWPRRAHLLYHMCISWQWPAWAIWTTLLPILILNDLWFGTLGPAAGLGLYLLPAALWALTAGVLATLETKHTYPGPATSAALAKRLTRVVPYVAVNAGMLPHQFSAFCEGLFGPLHSEFERTPKAGCGTGTTRPVGRVAVHRPYVFAELAFAGYQAVCAALFVAQGLHLCALGAAVMAGCVLTLAHLGSRREP
ncbi:glycosyltransferase family 2 protein [Phytohabitans flavus]|uniref:glycosyltransferase family 2 protein n=1 Tax=Phytohabitans flavus TaxID=1076124 RepID=UPI00366BD0E9